MLPQDRGHLARLDPESADLDLIVEPAEVLEGPVGPAADPVAGPVHALARGRDVRARRTWPWPPGRPGSRAPRTRRPGTSRRARRRAPARGRRAHSSARRRWATRSAAAPGRPAGTAAVVTATVHSAGPYRLTRLNGRPGGTPRWRAEPPVCIILSAVCGGHRSSSTASASGVGRNVAVICSSASQPTRPGGEVRTGAGGTTSVPPAAKGGPGIPDRHVEPRTAQQRRPVLRAERGRRFWRHRIRFARLPWLTATPLGRPVEPDVKTT